MVYNKRVWRMGVTKNYSTWIYKKKSKEGLKKNATLYYVICACLRADNGFSLFWDTYNIVILAIYAMEIVFCVIFAIIFV